MNTNMLRVSLLFLLVAIFSFANAQNEPLDQYRWTSIKASGEVTGRHENAFVKFNDKFYLLGGRKINPVNVFDPKTNTWETKKKTPFEFHHFQPVVYKDAIYIVGAMTGGYPKERPLENIWIYYPIKDSWEKGPEIPKAIRRGGAGAVLYKDKIYLVCGIEFGHTSGTNNNFDSYDLKTGEWERLTKAPNIRDHFSAIIVNEKLYCIGGRNTSIHYDGNFEGFFSATMPYVDVYDFSTQKWQTLKATLPVPTAAGGVVNIEDKILYIGGEGSQSQAYNNTQCLDVNSGKWEQLAPLNIGRHGSSAIRYNNDIYMAAGSQYKGGGNMGSIEVFSSKHNWTVLFDGKSLAGWEVKSTDNDKDKTFWKVENGNIVCNSMGSKDHNYVWLYNQKEFDNFELRLKFQSTRTQKGNSGVQFRSRYDEEAKVEKNATGWLDGPQADIDPNEHWRNGYIYDENRGTRRWIHPDLPDWKIDKDKYAPKKYIHYFEDEESGWNDMTIICDGTTIKTYVNNVLVTDFEGSKVLKDKSHKKNKVGMKGHIALQLHKNDENLIRFKDIEIRPIE